MMMQKYPLWFSLVFTLFYLPALYGQNNYTLQGVISDASNGEPMIGATVIDKALNTGITSNNYGFYSLSLPQGSYALEASYLGFESQQFTVALTENKQLDIALFPASDQLEEVIVTGEEIPTKEQNESVISRIEVLSVREIKSIPPLLGEVDITRALLTQAGISSVGEGKQSIIMQENTKPTSAGKTHGTLESIISMARKIRLHDSHKLIPQTLFRAYVTISLA